MKNGTDIIATFDADSDYYLLTDLEKNKEYTYTVYAVDLAGNISKGGEVTFVTDSGKPENGWKQTEEGWQYYEDGNKVTGWHAIDGYWYHFNEAGIMETGWVAVEGKWYYLNSDGSMETGWASIGGKWYYLNSDGSMAVSQWIGDYYVQSDGSMAVSQWIDGYYVDASGKWVRNA